MRSRIVSVSADKTWRDSVARACAELPHSLAVVSSPDAGWDTVDRREADLLLLDIELPGLDRLGWFKLLRRTEIGEMLPVILASLGRDEEEVAEAFAHDAGDFVLKDCAPAELAARIKAVLRRGTARPPALDGPIKLGVIALDQARHRCLVRNAPVELKPREFQLLEILMLRPGRVLSRAYLLETVWGMSAAADTRAVDVTVSRLRRALGRRAGLWIETVERYGYRFRDPKDVVR